MRGWIASWPLRWLVFLLTTWCLNSDAVEAVFAHGYARAATAAAFAVTPNSTTTISAFHLAGNHRVRIRERCDCHRGTVLPTGRTAVAWMTLPSIGAPEGDLELHLSVTSPPDLPPPRL